MPIPTFTQRLRTYAEAPITDAEAVRSHWRDHFEMLRRVRDDLSASTLADRWIRANIEPTGPPRSPRSACRPPPGSNRKAPECKPAGKADRDAGRGSRCDPELGGVADLGAALLPGGSPETAGLPAFGWREKRQDRGGATVPPRLWTARGAPARSHSLSTRTARPLQLGKQVEGRRPLSSGRSTATGSGAMTTRPSAPVIRADREPGRQQPGPGSGDSAASPAGGAQ